MNPWPILLLAALAMVVGVVLIARPVIGSLPRGGVRLVGLILIGATTLYLFAALVGI